MSLFEGGESHPATQLTYIHVYVPICIGLAMAQLPAAVRHRSGGTAQQKKKGGGGSILPLFLLFLFVDGKREGEKERESQNRLKSHHMRVI